MALIPKQSSYVRTFLMVMNSDHLTAATGATVTVLIAKTGGTFASAGGTVAEMSSGWYKISLNTADTISVGDLTYHCIASNCDPTDFSDEVVAFDPTNSTSLGLSNLDTTISSRLASASTSANFNLLSINSNGAVDIWKLNGSVINNLKSGRFDVDGSAVATTAGTVNDKTGYSLASGQLFVKKNTQLNNLAFVMNDSTNHQPKTGLTVAPLYSIDGGAFSATSSAVVEMTSGWYKINLAASELNGTAINLHFSATAADDRNMTIITQA